MRTSRVTKRRKNRRGFTLIEILLVLGILVVLGSVVGVAVLQMQVTAYERAAKNQLNQLNAAITAYQLDVGRPPDTLEGLVNAPDDVPEGKWKGPYVPKAIPVDPWDQAYQYEANGDNYSLYSGGKNRVAGDQDDIHL